MGSTLYTKIQLGRAPLFATRGAQLALLIGIAVSAGLGWYALRVLR